MDRIIYQNMKKFAVGVILSLLALASAMDAGAQERAAWPAAPVVSPEKNGDQITFRIKAPNAERVTFNGSWMSFMENPEMTRNADGVWEYTVSGLEPDLYQYTFNVDGVTMADPNCLNHVRDGASYRTWIAVKGENEPAPYEFESSTCHGKLEKVWYDASVYGKQRRLSVYLPYGYEESDGKYPVFYLQHGGGGDEEAWPTLGRVCELMDYMIERGLCKPMVVVMPNCNPVVAASHEVTLPDRNPENMADPDFAEGISHVKSMYTDIIPFVESHYKVLTGKENRAIAGLSMGGIYTLNLTQMRPDLFDYIGVLSMGTTPEKKAVVQLTPVKDAGYKLYYVCCGESDIAWSNAERLLAGLNELDMDYVYYGDVPGHQWETWRKCVLDLAPRLFK